MPFRSVGLFGWVHDPVARKRVGLIAALCVCLAVALSAWLVSSPVGSATDDDFHLASIYCASSAPAQYCQPQNGEYAVPIEIWQASYCYRGQYPGQSASCQDLNLSGQTQLLSPGQVNKTSLYPGGFYWVMGFFAGGDVQASVFAMGAASIFLAVIGIVGALSIAPPNIRQAGGIGFLVAANPFGWFLIPSTNPSSWALLGIGLYWVLLLTHLLTESEWRRWVSGGGAIVLAGLACIARADAGPMLIVLDLAVGILVYRRRLSAPRLRSAGIIVVWSLIVAAWSLLISGQTGASSGAIGGNVVAVTGRGLNSLIFNLVNFPQYVFGVFGYAEMGWLNVTHVGSEIPLSVPILATMLIGALLFVGFSQYSRSIMLAWLLVVVAIMAYPGWIWFSTKTAYPSIMQPRYVLPLLPAAIGIPFLRSSTSDQVRFATLQRWAWWGACLAIFSISLYWNIERYSAGLQPTTVPNSIDLSNGATWWPIPVVSPMEMWGLATVSVAAGLFLAMPFLFPDAARHKK